MEDWKKKFVASYLAANGRRVKLVPLGGDWYRIVGTTNRFKARHRSDLEAMTRTLQKRVRPR